MKYLFFGFILMITISVSKAQDIPESEIPVSVKKNFSNFFQDAENIKWQKSVDNYIVLFNKGEVKGKAILNQRGNLIRGEEDVAEKDLPANIKPIIEKDCAGYTITRIVKVQENARFFYSIETMKGKENKTLLFNTNGELINK